MFDVDTLVRFVSGPVRSLIQYSLLPAPGHCAAQKCRQQPWAQFLKQPHLTTAQVSKVLLTVLQWWPREAGWGHGPGLCGERDAMWAGHGVPGPSLPPHRGLQLQHLPGHHRQPDLFRTWGRFLHSSRLFTAFYEYLALCSLLAGPFRKVSVALDVIQLEKFLKTKREGGT